MSKTKYIAEAIRGSKVELFSSRDTVDEAFEFAKSIAKANGMPESQMTTAIIVYHNTLIELIAKEVENEES